MTTNEKPTIGIIGAGRLGTVLAKQALKAGYKVRIANSRGPETLSLILRVLLPVAQAATVHDVIELSDIIILAIPLNKYKSLPPELFHNKIVIDAMNYWPPTEGRIEEFDDDTSSSSVYMQKYLTKARLVKTLNHVAYNELNEHSLPEGNPNRRAIVMASDDKEAKLQIAKVINDLGFDPVDLGRLEEGKKFQPGTNLFDARFTESEIKTHVTNQ